MGVMDIAEIVENYRSVLERIHKAAERSNRDPKSIKLIAVSKTVSAQKIRQAVECGALDFGENRLQEAQEKMDDLRPLGLTWHFIGHIQTNKAKKVAECFDWIHSVDRIDVADKLGRTTPKLLSVLLEVKLHDEPNKSGAAVSDLPELIAAVRRYESLDLRGLMAVPPFLDNPEEVRPYFRRLRELSNQHGLKELSMGMTHDFEVAIEEGATMVRVGTGLFGKRG
ncbi:MAG TPA: YggS family pyridoxal phosphate-dependent enzyme [Terriglobia bacterium]|nr:YggS family pyridoxal phosphate-dependent enzyme [Terriglobia bacterium]